MKVTITKLFIAALLVPIFICDCSNKIQNCYIGKVISLNKGDGCKNVLAITKSPENEDLVVDSSISFDPDLFQTNLDYGDLVSFSIISYENYKWISNTACLIPQYAGIIEPCSD